MEEAESRVCGDVGIGVGVTEISTVYDDIDDVDIDPAKFQIEEGMVAEVMKRLEEEINQPCGVGGVGGDDFAAGGRFHQYQPAPSLPSSSAAPFVTINGNEESCGPSFSDSASTVMASIDTRGVVGLPQLAPPCAGNAEAALEEEIWPWYPESEAEAAFGSPPAATADFCVEDMGVAGDDGWLARVLAGAGLEGDGEERLGG